MVVVIFALLSVVVSFFWIRRLTYWWQCNERIPLLGLLMLDELIWFLAGGFALLIGLSGLFCGGMGEPDFNSFVLMLIGNLVYCLRIVLDIAFDSPYTFLFSLWLIFRLYWKLALLKDIYARTSHPFVWIVGTLVYIYMPLPLFGFMAWQSVE